MLYFPETFLYIVIIGSLIFSGVAFVALLLFLFKDKKTNKVW